jgi:uncharacterized protein involved in exopolysaccharide biosynthesis
MQSAVRDVLRDPDESQDLFDLLGTAWRGRWLIGALGLVFGALGAAYVAVAPKWYRAEVLLVQTKDRSPGGMLSQFGGLASLAGISINSGDDAEPLAVLKSRGFAQSFIEEKNLTNVILAHKWDAAEGRWKGPEMRWPDVRDAVTYFDRKIRRVTLDRKTGLVTIAIEWKDPVVAADWANTLAVRLNEQMRERAIAESTENVGYLKAEIAANSLVALQQPMSNLLEMELQKAMLARSNRQFAFRVIDSAQPPKRSFKPKMVPVVALSTLLGAFLALVALLFRRSIQSGMAPKGRA